MKQSLFALGLTLLLTSCAGVRVTHTDIATGATNPSAIYIRPFDISDCVFTGRHHSPGEFPIRKSLAPVTFAEDLKEQLELIAPAMVLKDGEAPASGWLVEGSIDLVDSGHPGERAVPVISQFGHGASHIMVHVRILDLSARRVVTVTDKDAACVQAHGVATRRGAVIYEFDVAGGSRATGKFGSITAPGLGYAPPFDYRNAAERVYEALSTDEFKYGIRSSPALR